MVNTFLPHASFTRSAAVLDRARLGKQRVEVLQLIKANRGETVGWVNHPAAVMWRGYHTALCMYGMAVCSEWQSRGYRDTCMDQIYAYLPWPASMTIPSVKALHKSRQLPWWFGSTRFHRSHRSNLYRKAPDLYPQFEDDGPMWPYVWPSENDGHFNEKHAKGSAYGS